MTFNQYLCWDKLHKHKIELGNLLTKFLTFRLYACVKILLLVLNFYLFLGFEETGTLLRVA